MNMPKRILQLGLSEHLGGIETYLLKISKNLDMEKYKFDFLISNGIEPCFKKELEALGCGFHNIIPRNKNYLTYIKELDNLIKNENYDIIHCNLNSLSNFEPVLIGMKNHKKVVVHSHNSAIISSLKSRILNRLGYVILLNKPIERVAVSDLAGEWMFGKKNKFNVLNNGIDVEKYQYNLTWRNEIRNEFNIKNRELILHVGAFRKQKNHKQLIEIFKAYNEKKSDAILMLVGDGELKADIINITEKLKLTENVIFTGIRNDVPKLMSAADKFLLPSFYEGFPNVLIEAESSGLYCVVSDAITKQAMLNGLCKSLSLADPLDNWVAALDESNSVNRFETIYKVMSAELDIKSEMKRLYAVYEKN